MVSINKIINSTNAKQQANGSWLGHCPVHDDKNPSLSITEKNNKILVHCHAGCSQDELAKELGVGQKNNSFVSSNSSNKHLIKRYFNFRGIKNLKEEDLNKFKVIKSREGFILQIDKMDWDSGELIGNHSIYINNESRNIKEGSKNKKRTNGRIENNFPFFGDLTSDTVHITEGLEDALAIRSNINELVVASLGTSNFNKIKTLPFKNVHIWADNDEAGTKTAKGLADSIFEDKDVYIHIPPTRGADWLDEYNKNSNTIIDEISTCCPIGWDKPEKFDIEPTKLPILNQDDIPKDLYDYVMDNYLRSGSHHDYSLTSTIAILSAIFSRSFVVQPKENDNSWLEPIILCGLVIGEPGTMKSHGLKLGIKFVDYIDKFNAEIEREYLKEHKAKKSIIEAKKKKLKDSLDLEKRLEITKEEENLKLKFKLLKMNDSTPQALLKRASGTSNTILYFRDEFSAILLEMNKESSAAIRQLLLEGWHGLNSFIKETVGRGLEKIERLSLVFLGGIQPSKIKPYLKEIHKGINDDGLLQRVQLIAYPRPTRIKTIDKAPNNEPEKRIKDIIKKIYDYEQKYPGLITIHLTKDARELFEEYWEKLQDTIYTEAEGSLLKSFLSKYPRLILSLSLIFHVLEDNQFLDTHSPISRESMRKAVAMTKYYKSHLLRLLDETVNEDKQVLCVFAQKLIDDEIKSHMTLRDIYRKGWKGITKESIAQIAEYFTEINWIKVIECRSSKGGRSTKKILINPKLKEDSCA
jgi:hypothetical protein